MNTANRAGEHFHRNWLPGFFFPYGIYALLLSLAAVVGNGTAFAQANVIAWGSNTFGQTNVPSDLTNAVAVAVGQGHSVALRSDGTVVAWGRYDYGQTNVPPGLSNVMAIACGAYHTLALQSNGTVVVWGGMTSKSPPADLSNVVAVIGSIGSSHALLSDGSIRSWGAVSNLAPGIGNIITFGASQSIDAQWMGTTLNGALLYPNNFFPYQLPSNLVYSLYSGGPALTYDGRVSRYVSNQYVDAGLSNVIALCPNLGSFLALKSDGTVYGGPAYASNVVAIASATSASHYLALVGVGAPVFSTRSRDFSINYGRTARFYAPATGAWPMSYQWRLNGNDVPGATTPMLAVTNVSAASFGVYELVASNAVSVTVSPPFMLSLLPIVGPDLTPNLTDVVSIASSGAYGNYLALKRDRTVVAWGPNGVGQCNVPASLSNVVAISCYSDGSIIGASRSHCLALADSGTVYSWGVNSFTNSWPSLTNVSFIRAGKVQDAVVTADGGLGIWSTTFSTNPINGPTIRSGIANVVGVDVDRSGTAQYTWVSSDGRPWGFAAPASLSNVIAVSEGYYYFLGLLADGTVVPWGSNSQQQTNAAAGLSNVVQISSSDQNYSAALKSDGTIAAWGQVPPQVSNIVATATNAVLVDGAVALIGNGRPFVLNRGIDRNASPCGQVYFREVATGERPLHYQWQFEGADLPGETNNVLRLTNVQLSQSGAYTLVVTNTYGAVTSSPSLLNVYDYSSALGGSGIAWSSFGDGIWVPETNVTHDGVAAAQASLVPGSSFGSSSTLRGTLTGPGTLTFWWKIQSIFGPEYLSFYRNGESVSEFFISSPTDWQQCTVYLGAGAQTVDFVYRSYNSAMPGDGAWLDQVVFVPGTTTPFITEQPGSRSQAPGGNVAFGVSAQGTPPFLYQWSFGTQLLSWTTNSSIIISNVHASDVGKYSVVVSNMAGNVASLNATLVLGRIATWPWSFTPDTLTNAIALDGIYALLPDGTVKCWPTYATLAIPDNVTNAISVSGGSEISCAVNAADGTITAWGANTYGQTNVPPGLSNIVMVSCGYAHTAALKSDGTVVCWGYNYYGQTNVPPGLTNVVYVCAGGENTLALKSDGTLVAWGDNSYGQTNIPVGLTNVVAARLSYQGLALHPDGTVGTRGNTNNGLATVPESITNVVAVACGDADVILNSEGELRFWGPSSFYTPTATLVPLSFLERSVRAGIIADAKPDPQVSTRNPRVSSGAFQVSVATKSGRVYRLEYKNNVDDSAWTGLPLVAGSGREQVLSDSSLMAAQRFYRVRSW